MLVRQLWPIKQLGQFALRAGSRANIWPKLAQLAPDSLRVLMYHRVCDPDAPGFFGMRSVVSATPSGFAAQVEYLSRNYNLISLDDCLGWIYDSRPLPPRSMMITFDDGYRDNLTNAMPVLAARKIPFILFPAIAYLDDQRVFLWDGVAEAFRNTNLKSAKLPRLGVRDWSREGDEDRIAEEWFGAIGPLDEKTRAMEIEELSELLNYDVLAKPPAGTHLSWPDLQEMTRHGCTVGAHTVTHPMMLRMPPEEVSNEIEISKDMLEKKLGISVLSFAFPFGRLEDYDPAYVPLLSRTGLKVAFRSTGAINFIRGARSNPFEIRRCGVGLQNRLGDFAAFASGTPRLWEH